MGESGCFSILRKLLIMPNDNRNKKLAKAAILDFKRKFNTENEVNGLGVKLGVHDFVHFMFI